MKIKPNKPKKVTDCAELNGDTQKILNHLEPANVTLLGNTMAGNVISSHVIILD